MRFGAVLGVAVAMGCGEPRGEEPAPRYPGGLEGFPPSGEAPPLPALATVPCTPRFSMRAIDDSPKVALDAVAEKLPEGASVGSELAPISEVSSVPRLHFMIEGDASTIGKREVEVSALAKGLVPGGRELVFGPAEPGRVRSFIAGPCLLGDGQVEGARTERASVEITMTADGRARLAEATRALAQRRVAFMVDGEALMVAVVTEPITGGRVELAVADEKEAVEVARKLKR